MVSLLIPHTLNLNNLRHMSPPPQSQFIRNKPARLVLSIPMPPFQYYQPRTQMAMRTITPAPTTSISSHAITSPGHNASPNANAGHVNVNTSPNDYRKRGNPSPTTNPNGHVSTSQWTRARSQMQSTLRTHPRSCRGPPNLAWQNSGPGTLVPDDLGGEHVRKRVLLIVDDGREGNQWEMKVRVSTLPSVNLTKL